MAKSTIKLPNGTVIEISPDMTPEQITAMVSAVASPSLQTQQSGTAEETTGETIVIQRNVEEIWHSSKREKVALFIRNFFSDTVWITAKDVVDQQIAELGTVELGESSQIGTYMARLFDGGYLDKQPIGRNVKYRITQKLVAEFPVFQVNELTELMQYL